MDKKILYFSIILLIFLLNLNSPGEAQSRSPAELAKSLKLQPGFSFNIQPNIFGFSTQTKSDIGIKKVKVKEVIPDKIIELSWKIKNKSNEKIITTTGQLTADIFNQTSGLLLPVCWPKGNHKIINNTLIWLSKDSFKKIKQTGQIKWKTGFCENPMAEISRATREVKKSLSGKTSKKQRTSGNFLIADPIPVKYSININEQPKIVQAILAHTEFIDLVILDNPDNPLILKAMLKPALSGTFDIMAPFIVLKTFLGYEITDIYTSGYKKQP